MGGYGRGGRPAVDHEGRVAGVVVEEELGSFGREGGIGGLAARGFLEGGWRGRGVGCHD